MTGVVAAYALPSLPAHWVVQDEQDNWWILGAGARSWASKRPYKGYTTPAALGEPVNLNYLAGTDAPRDT